MAMEAMALKKELDQLIFDMHIEGLLDSQFKELQMHQDPQFLVGIITIFCQEAARIVEEIAKILAQPVVDYCKVDDYLHQLKGSSSSVGAQWVKCACIIFKQAHEWNDKERCMEALDLVVCELFRVRGKFDRMVQGLLDSFFDELEMLQDPLLIVQITTMYCEETTRIIEELTKNLVGAQQVKLACLNFIQACKEKDRERCMQDLEMINHEFYIIRSKFKILHQIEKRIRTYNAMQR